jgi:hypothetical protein
VSPKALRRHGPRQYRCIYCLERKDAPAFNRDHVMPVLLGTFSPNFTLVRAVCKSCNGALGRETEDILGVDSFEAYQRFASGLKRSNANPRLFSERVRARMGKDPRIEGARLDLHTNPDAACQLKWLRRSGFATTSKRNGVG